MNISKNVLKAGFNNHVFSVSVQQHISQSFAKIMQAIDAERTSLKNMLTFNSKSSKAAGISKASSNFQSTPGYGNYQTFDAQVLRSGRYDKIKELSTKGLNPRKIAEVLKIPISEVELVLSLQRIRSSAKFT